MNVVFIALCAAAVMTGSVASASAAKEAEAAGDAEVVRTYSWAETPDSGNAPLDRRIVTGIDARLEAKGWKRRASGGRLSIAVDIVPGAEVPQADTLLVDLFDTASHQAVWHGTAHDGAARSALLRNRALEASLDQMFAAFPMRQAAAR